MDAVIFAAGLGTRLRPLTEERPKALVEVGGVPMLERVARRLVAAGADRLIVNVHPFAEQVEAFVRARDGFGVEVVLSHEREAPLETGGGLKHAAGLLRRDAPFLVHNVDVMTDLPLGTLYAAQRDAAPLATLAVMERATERFLLFDALGLLGRIDRTKGVDLRVREPRGEVSMLAFAGVHVVSPDLLVALEETGAFSILDPYLRLAGEGAVIRPYRVDAHAWIDVGRPEQLARAEARLAGSGHEETRDA